MMGHRLDWASVLTPENLSVLAGGLAVTVVLAVFSGVLATALGLGIVILRYSGRPSARRFADAFVELFRNIPALVLVLAFSFALPLALPLTLRRQLLFDNLVIDSVFDATGVHLYYFIALALALSLNTAGYLVEVFRAGFESIDTIQVDAGYSTGLSRRQVLRYLIVPQGLGVSVPPATNRLIHNLKNTALAIFVPVPDFFSAVQSVISRTFRGLELIIIGVAVYLLLSWITAGLLARSFRSAGAKG